MKNIVNLGNVATYINGYAFKPSDWAEDGTPIIRIQDLTGNSYQMNRFKGIVDSKYNVNSGDVLISWSASLGVYVWNRGNAVLNQHIFKVVFDKEEVDKDFFVFQIDNLLKRAANQAHGATMRHLTKPVFDALPFYLPDIKTQRLISSKLNLIVHLIEDHHEQLKKLDELIRSRFIEMFGDPNDVSILSLPGEKKSIEDVCDGIYGGGTPSKSHKEYYTGKIPWVTPKDMKTLSIDDSQNHINSEAIENSTAKLIPKRCVLMVIRSGILKHTLPVAINNVEVTINQDMKAFVPSSLITPEYLLYTFKLMEKSILSKIRGVTADNIEFSEFRKRRIVVPPIEVQTQFVDFALSIDKSKMAVQKSLDELETLKKSLMQTYFG